jgi:hypothetical protein
MRTGAIVCFCLLSFAIHGQKEFSGGLVAGPVTTQISGDGLGGWDKYGFCGGAWVRMPLSEKSGLLLSMTYFNKGSMRVDTLTRTSYGFVLDYVEVPILFDRKTDLANSKIRWQFGPSIGYLIRQKIKSNGNFYEPIPAFSRLDFGIAGGVAYDITAKYQLAFRSSTSILPTRPAPTNPVANSYYLKGNYNQTLQLLFSVRL